MFRTIHLSDKEAHNEAERLRALNRQFESHLKNTGFSKYLHETDALTANPYPHWRTNTRQFVKPIVNDLTRKVDSDCDATVHLISSQGATLRNNKSMTILAPLAKIVSQVQFILLERLSFHEEMEQSPFVQFPRRSMVVRVRPAHVTALARQSRFDDAP